MGISSLGASQQSEGLCPEWEAMRMLKEVLFIWLICVLFLGCSYSLVDLQICLGNIRISVLHGTEHFNTASLSYGSVSREISLCGFGHSFVHVHYCLTSTLGLSLARDLLYVDRHLNF